MFLLSATLWLIALLIIPMTALVVVSFASRGTYGEIVWQFSVNNFRRLAGYGYFEWTPDYLLILARSVWVALITTLFSIVLSYPLAFYIAGRPAKSRYLWLALVIIPLCTNLVIRTYAWMLILAQQMPPAWIAQKLGLIGSEEALYPSPFAVYLGMISSFLPFATLPLYTSVERLDWSIIEAAQDLYASKWGVFRHAILLQMMLGLTVATVLTFIPAMGMFVVPDILGGAKYMLVGNLIQQQFGSSRDWPFGAAVSLGLMTLTLIGLFIILRRGKTVEIV